MATDISDERIPHRLSLYVFVISIAYMVWQAPLSVVLCCLGVWVGMLAFFAAIGVGPLGHHLWLSQRRIQAGQQPLFGGGDPLWVATSLCILTFVGFKQDGVSALIIGIDIPLETTFSLQWLSGATTAAAGFLLMNLLALLFYYIFNLWKSELQHTAKFGPSVVLGNGIIILLASM